MKLPNDSFALINMIGFRCRFDQIKSLGPVYAEAYQSYTKNLLDALRPGLIVPLGKDQGIQLAKLYRGEAPVSGVIRRSIGDRFDPNTLDEDVRAAVRDYRVAQGM